MQRKRWSAVRRVELTIIVLGLCLTVGCSTITTSIHAAREPTNDGVSYFLPTNRVRIVFTNGTIPSEIKAATDALSTAEKAVPSATDDLEAAKRARAAVDPKNVDEVKKLDELVKAAKKALADAEDKVDKAKKALEETKRQKEQILAEVLPPIADPSQLYVAKLNHFATYQDKVAFKTSADGLLTQISLKAEDQTREVVRNLVETVIEGAKLYARLHGVPIGSPPAPADQKDKAPMPPRECGLELDKTKPYYFEFSIDPSRPEELAVVNLRLLYTRLPFLMEIRGTDAAYALPSSSAKDVSGVYYRRPLPYTVEILESFDRKRELCESVANLKDTESRIAKIRDYIAKNRAEIPTAQSKQVVMAAGGPVSWLKLDGRPFVTTELVANFKDGMLLDATETRPSELVGATLIPLDTVKAVGNAVGEVLDNLIPVQVKWTNQQKDLIKAQTDLMQAYKDKAELQKQIVDQLPAATALPAPPNP